MRTRWFDELPDPLIVDAIPRFLERFLARRGELAGLAANLCRTPIAHHLEDVDDSIAECAVLASHRLEAEPRVARQPRGAVLVGLSANEPLVVGVIPIVAGLLYGNRLRVRPSRQNVAIMDEIVGELWNAGVPRDRVELVSFDPRAIGSGFDAMDHVVWFGSADSCRSVLKQAADANLGCTLEAEGFDVAIVEESVEPESLALAARFIIRSVARHSGQICQAIRAVVVAAARFDEFLVMLQREASALKIGPAGDRSTEITVPFVIDVQSSLAFPDSAPFEPRMLVAPFASDGELQSLLRQNPYGLSISVFTSSPPESTFRSYAAIARVGRILVNCDPRHVDPVLPWGGYRRSGSGPATWADKFTDIVIRYTES